MMQPCTNRVQCIAKQLVAITHDSLLFTSVYCKVGEIIKTASPSPHVPELSACDKWQSSGGEPNAEGCGLPNQGLGTSLSGVIKGCNAPGDSRLTSQHSTARDLRRLLAPACSDRSSSRS